MAGLTGDQCVLLLAPEHTRVNIHSSSLSAFSLKHISCVDNVSYSTFFGQSPHFFFFFFFHVWNIWLAKTYILGQNILFFRNFRTFRTFLSGCASEFSFPFLPILHVVFVFRVVMSLFTAIAF